MPYQQLTPFLYTLGMRTLGSDKIKYFRKTNADARKRTRMHANKRKYTQTKYEAREGKFKRTQTHANKIRKRNTLHETKRKRKTRKRNGNAFEGMLNASGSVARVKINLYIMIERCILLQTSRLRRTR